MPDDELETKASAPLGSRWRGISGNVMEVIEVAGDQVLLAYVDDPEDCSWEVAADVAHVKTRLG